MSTAAEPSKKRKRNALDSKSAIQVAQKAGSAVNGKISRSDIGLLEAQIKESPKHYNNIPILLNAVKSQAEKPKLAQAATLSLCRIFCQMISLQQMSKDAVVDKNRAVLAEWLRERYHEYVDLLLKSFAKSSSGFQVSFCLCFF
jgi:U3 small nucleolar RNA-associated protein 19